MSSKLRRTGIIAGFAALGILLGAGGGTAALWSDSASGSGTISSGYEHFAAGRVDRTVPAKDRKVTVTLGASDAETLVKNGEIAIPLQTDSLSQGNKGLRYSLTPPPWTGGVFGASDVRIWKVASARDCTVANAPANPPRTLTSTPVSADYSDGDEPTVEYWCVAATLKNGGEVGEYANTATVKAKDPAGSQATATDRWNAKVGIGLDPTKEPDHPIVFEYSTFRPGA